MDASDKPHYLGLDHRISPRSDVYYRMAFDLPDGRLDMATCVNISSDGLLMRHPESFDPDAMLIFHLPVLGMRPAKVIWSLSGKTGVQFDQLINEPDYLTLIQAIDGETEN